jgi:salicylate hydroxylase
VLNLALLHPTRESEKDHAQNWQTPASPESVLEVIKELHSAVQRLVRMSPDITCYTISARDPLPTLFREKAVLVGDAAHPIAPTHAQGAVLVMEESAALGVLLHGANTSTLKPRLEAYNDLMSPHCAAIQILSNNPTGMDDETLKKLREVYVSRVPEQGMPFSKPYRDFFYSWNIFDEAKAKLETLDSGGE